MWDLVPWPGIEPRTPALEFSHWTTREVPQWDIFWYLSVIMYRMELVMHMLKSPLPHILLFLHLIKPSIEVAWN